MSYVSCHDWLHGCSASPGTVVAAIHLRDSVGWSFASSFRFTYLFHTCEMQWRQSDWRGRPVRQWVKWTIEFAGCR